MEDGEEGWLNRLLRMLAKIGQCRVPKWRLRLKEAQKILSKIWPKRESVTSPLCTQPHTLPWLLESSFYIRKGRCSPVQQTVMGTPPISGCPENRGLIPSKRGQTFQGHLPRRHQNLSVSLDGAGREGQCGEEGEGKSLWRSCRVLCLCRGCFPQHLPNQRDLRESLENWVCALPSCCLTPAWWNLRVRNWLRMFWGQKGRGWVEWLVRADGNQDSEPTGHTLGDGAQQVGTAPCCPWLY